MKQFRVRMIVLILAVAVIAGWCGAQFQRMTDQEALTQAIDSSFGQASSDLEGLDYCEQLIQSLYRAEAFASLSEDADIQDVGEILGKLAEEEKHDRLTYNDKQEFARLLDEMRIESDRTAGKASEIIALYQDILIQAKEPD